MRLPQELMSGVTAKAAALKNRYIAENMTDPKVLYVGENQWNELSVGPERLLKMEVVRVRKKSYLEVG